MHKYISSSLIIVGVVFAIFLLFKLVKHVGVTGEQVQSERPMVICSSQDALSSQRCYWTAHIHAQVSIFHKGKELDIGYEQGDLQRVHTHATKNKLHWHGLLSVDQSTKKITDTVAFRVDTIPQDLNIELKGDPSFIVNGIETDGAYQWQDGDKIEIYYEEK